MTHNSEDRRGPRRRGREPVRSGPAGRGGAKPGPDRRAARSPEGAPESAPAPMPAAEERIAKVIARAGIASRRDAEAMIAAGRVTLNGAPVTSPALNVGLDDRIAVDGEPLPLRERTRLWLFHKPRGLVTTFRDPQGRPTVFEALPEEMPRVVAIGRLDMNTEGLLLLTNDGGLAKVIAHPETGWTRRYRVRAHGDVTQAELDRLRGGITVEGIEYGPIEATLDRVQGDNSWLTMALREGKNREIKRILEHLGLQVNRLIRLSFGPFQLGDLEPGLVEEVRTKVLREQLGPALAAEAGVDFESPVREPIAPFGSESRARKERPGRIPEPRRAAPDDRPGRRPWGREQTRSAAERARPDERRPTRLEPYDRSRTAWRADDPEQPKPVVRPKRRLDPKAERAASAGQPRERLRPIDDGQGRRIRVERIKPGPEEPRGRRDKSARPGQPGASRPLKRQENGRGDRPGKRPPFAGETGRAFGARGRPDRPGPSRSGRPGKRPPDTGRPRGRDR